MIRNLLKSIPILVFLSIAIHLLAFSGAGLLSKSFVQKSPAKNVEVVILPPRDKSDRKVRQIVEQSDKAINDVTPEKDYYLSKNNQRVNKQTRAAKVGTFTNQVQAGQKQASQNKKVPKKNKPKAKKKMAQSNDNGVPSLADLTPKFDAERKYGQFQKNLPGKESQTSNHLKDVEVGLQTMLNTREFVYYSYYQRIRSKIRQIWEPLIRAKVKRVFEQGRTIASARDRVTKVVIILNEGGHLIRVQVVGESGVHDLDEAAVEAFRAAEPFPNPPDGIVEKDGTIRIRWDFILEA